MTEIKDFKVAAVSSNTNSFGLRQMILVSEDGMTFTSCFNYLNVKKAGDIVQGIVNTNENKVHAMFKGGELTEMVATAPRSIIKELWRKDR